MAFDKTNTAIVFVEDGLFNKQGVEKLQNDNNKPVIVVKANIDGVEKEISLWFSKDKETGQYKLTKQGNKMLTGKVADPYQGDGFAETSTTPKPEFSEPETSNELPF
tara:strand:+ start:159 stop:479 length:321 start_codon:yes stop_codon:yes gene_type:complete